MEFTTVLLSTGLVHIRFKGWWVMFFNSTQILIEYSASKQWRLWSETADVVSDLGLHMSYKKDARLIGVKESEFLEKLNLYL